MRVTLFLLPALAAAQAQKPLGEQVQGWFDKAKGYLPTGVREAAAAAAATVKSPVDAGASVVAAKVVEEITTSNWEEVLRPRWHQKTGTWGPDSYMVLVTGGNRTCYGRCERLEGEFNKTAALLSTDRDAPHLASLDCDAYGLLCSTWFAGPPTVWYLQFPEQRVEPGSAAAKAEPTKEVPLHVFRFNTTTVNADSIARIYKDRRFDGQPPVDSWFHPWNGQLAQYGLLKPVGYAFFAFSMIPSWSLMILVSFLTRSFMSNRIGNPSARPGRTTAQEFANRPLGGAPSAAG